MNQTNHSSLPFLPFTKPTIDEETIAAVSDVLRSSWITSGPQCLEFEKQLSEFFGGRQVRCFANGTATMEIALRIANVGPGDEVITTPISWVSTSNVILTVGAKPVFVDVDPMTRNINLDLIEAAITPATKAIMPVYLSGLPVDINRLYQIAKKHHLRVIEDAAQALGSSWEGKRIGSSTLPSDLVSFSFQANKNLTTIEGGCLVMSSEADALLAQKLRIQGVTRSGLDGMEVDVLGGKFNLTDVNSVIGIHQLKRLPEFIQTRKFLAQHYFACFAKTSLIAKGVQLPLPDFENSNWHMFQIVLPHERMQQKALQRSHVMQALKDLQIGTGVHYPLISDFKLYKDLGYQSSQTPLAAKISTTILTLPLFPLMTFADVERVVDALQTVLHDF
jgi:dTDP-4-amino-4,6-dideoxygalactose transaminase